MDMPSRGSGRFFFDGADHGLILPVAVIALAAILLFVPFNLGVNVPAFLLALYIVVFSYQGRAGSESDRGSIYLLLLVLIGILPFLLYDTSPFRILQFVLLCFCVLFQIYTMYGRRYYKQLFSEDWLFDAINGIFVMPFANFPVLFRALSALPKEKKALNYTLLSVFGFLFAPALTVYLTHAYRAHALGIAAAIIGGAALFFFLCAYLYGFLYGCRRAVNTSLLKKPAPKKIRRVPVWVSIALLLILCIACTAYLVLQGGYLIPAISGRMEAADVAEYARRGFLELCGVVLLNLACILFTAIFTRVHTPKPDPETGRVRSASPAVLALIIALSILSILLVLTALVKMVLYMHTYGLTTNRIITSVFMIGLIIVCLIILARAFSPHVRLVRSISIAAVTLFLVLCFADCDYLALSYNRTAYLEGRLPGFDIEMLYQSSDSIVPVMIDVYENSSGQVRTDAKAFLDHYIARYDDTLGKARSFNIASYNAHNKYIEWAEGTDT